MSWQQPHHHPDSLYAPFPPPGPPGPFMPSAPNGLLAPPPVSAPIPQMPPMPPGYQGGGPSQMHAGSMSGMGGAGSQLVLPPDFVPPPSTLPTSAPTSQPTPPPPAKQRASKKAAAAAAAPAGAPPPQRIVDGKLPPGTYIGRTVVENNRVIKIAQPYTTGHLTCPYYPDCERTFKHASERVIHVRKVHTGEKPFKCSYEGCDKRFCSSKQLKSHERSHSNEKPFVCTECGKGLGCAAERERRTCPCSRAPRPAPSRPWRGARAARALSRRRPFPPPSPAPPTQHLVRARLPREGRAHEGAAVQVRAGELRPHVHDQGGPRPALRQAQAAVSARGARRVGRDARACGEP